MFKDGVDVDAYNNTCKQPRSSIEFESVKVKKIKSFFRPSSEKTTFHGDGANVRLSRAEALNLLDKADECLMLSEETLSEARNITRLFGLSVDSSILNPLFQSSDQLSDIKPQITLPQARESSRLQPSGSITFNSASMENEKCTKSGSKLNRTHMIAFPYNLETAFPNLVPISTGLVNTNNLEKTKKVADEREAAKFTSVLSTTAGHSNTDHVIFSTGDPKKDRIAELKRSLRRRARMSRPEERGEDRWDQPRVRGSGTRRRRILRQSDHPAAPPEAPLSGFIVYVGQMTPWIKKRDGKGRGHRQTTAMQEISKAWRFDLTPEEKDYYMEFAFRAKKEYQYQLREYRATGGYTKSKCFMRLGGGEGPWVKRRWNEKNDLEKELATYPIEIFQLAPDSRRGKRRIIHYPQTKDTENDLVGYIMDEPKLKSKRKVDVEQINDDVETNEDDLRTTKRKRNLYQEDEDYTPGET